MSMMPLVIIHAWILPTLLWKATLIRPTALVDTNSVVSYVTFTTTSLADVIFLWSPQLVVTNSARSFPDSWRLFDCFFIILLLVLCTIKTGTHWEWSGIVALSVGWITFADLSIKAVLNDTSTASSSTIRIFNRVHDSLLRRWKLMVPNTARLVPEAP